jgi:hypothetical protein
MCHIPEDGKLPQEHKILHSALQDCSKQTNPILTEELTA